MYKYLLFRRLLQNSDIYNRKAVMGSLIYNMGAFSFMDISLIFERNTYQIKKDKTTASWKKKGDLIT